MNTRSATCGSRANCVARVPWRRWIRVNTLRVIPPIVDASPTSVWASPLAIIPPRWLVGSSSRTVAPARAAEMAATMPPGVPP